jgi:hypothetical protein
MHPTELGDRRGQRVGGKVCRRGQAYQPAQPAWFRPDCVHRGGQRLQPAFRLIEQQTPILGQRQGSRGPLHQPRAERRLKGLDVQAHRRARLAQPSSRRGKAPGPNDFDKGEKGIEFGHCAEFRSIMP